MSTDLPVSVIVPTFDEGKQLGATVSSLLGADEVPREIVVVDDGSTDRSCDGPWPDAVQVVRQEHTGVAAARNQGARRATQPTLVFLDAHCSVESGWLTPLLAALADEPAALVGPTVQDARDHRRRGCGAQLVDPLLTYRWRPPEGSGAVAEVGLVPGGCLAVRSATFAAAAGFAPFTGLGAEDVELALRWWRAGRPSLGVPTSVVGHRFRTDAVYGEDHPSRVRNVLRTALTHLRGPRLRESVLACARYACFPTAVATVLAERSLAAGPTVAPIGRDVDDYLDRWAPRAFTAPRTTLDASPRERVE